MESDNLVITPAGVELCGVARVQVTVGGIGGLYVRANEQLQAYSVGRA